MHEHLRAHLTPTPTTQKKVKRFFFRFSFSDLHFFKIKITLDFCEKSKFDFFLASTKKTNQTFLCFFGGKSGYQSLRWSGRPRVRALLFFSLLTCAFPVLILPFGKLALGMQFCG